MCDQGCTEHTAASRSSIIRIEWMKKLILMQACVGGTHFQLHYHSFHRSIRISTLVLTVCFLNLQNPFRSYWLSPIWQFSHLVKANRHTDRLSSCGLAGLWCNTGPVCEVWVMKPNQVSEAALSSQVCESSPHSFKALIHTACCIFPFVGTTVFSTFL